MPLNGVTPFPPEFAEQYRARGYWLDQPLITSFEAAFRQFAGRIAIVAGTERVTYAELAERSERLARHLLDRGFGPLDRVVVHLPNVPGFIYLYFALQHVGAIPLMALPLHRHREIQHYVDFIEARGYAIPDRVGTYDYLSLARRVQGATAGSLTAIFVVGEHVPHEAPYVDLRHLLVTEPCASRDDLEQVRASIVPTDPCCFQLSGGTTGIPKVIPRTHDDYVYNSLASGEVNDIRPDDALLVVLPIAHNFPLASPGIQAFFQKGARVVLTTSVNPAEVLQLIEHERITHLEIVPAMIIRWLDVGTNGADMSSVRIVNSGGQKWQSETKVRTEMLFPHAQVQEVFGMAEGLLFFPRLGDAYEVRIETVGRPVCTDDEVRLVDDDGNNVPPGATGEMLCRGPYTLRGYFRAPDHNARVFTEDGFFKTGDLMRLHPSGNYIVEGRKKDVVNRGGEKISAEEVENLILQLPAVLNVACVPMPDRVLGEKMCAFIIPHAGQTIALPEISAHLTAEGLGRYKHPERLVLVQEFPISNFGKVQKNLLTQLISDTLQAEQATIGYQTDRPQ